MPEFDIGSSGKFVEAWKKATHDGKIDPDVFRNSVDELAELSAAAALTETQEDDDLVYYLKSNNNPDVVATVKSGKASQEISFVGAPHRSDHLFVKIAPDQVTPDNVKAFIEQREVKLSYMPRATAEEKTAYDAEKSNIQKEYVQAFTRLEKQGHYYAADLLFDKIQPGHDSRTFDLPFQLADAWKEAMKDGSLDAGDLAKLEKAAKKSKGDGDDKWVAFMKGRLGQPEPYAMKVKVDGQENLVTVKDGAIEVTIRPDQVNKHTVDAYMRQQNKRPGEDGLNEAKKTVTQLPPDSIEHLKLSDWIKGKERELHPPENIWGKRRL